MATIDMNQGQDAEGRTFGYVSGDGGGYFFTHRATRSETIASIEVDQRDGCGGLTRDEAMEALDIHLDPEPEKTIEEIASEIASEIVRDVLGEDLPREWTGLAPQYADRLESLLNEHGYDSESDDWGRAKSLVKSAYLAEIALA
jgi:hypothetical protein